MGNNLHCFNTNPLAKANAFGRPNDSIENYRNNFEYLIRGEDPINIRLNNLNNKKSSHKIKYVSDSALSELVGYAYPSDYVFYNSRSKKALNFLGIKLPAIRGAEFGDTFLTYNQSIKAIIDDYENIVGKKTTTTIPLEVDQFFSWLCDVKIKPTEANYDFFPILKIFVDQAQTENQKYSSYPKTYKELVLDVKFGQGGLYHVPYLSLLKNPNKVPDGIYPVYLYYKKDNILILSYGISETNTTNKFWPNMGQLQTIKSWYLNEFNEKPFRYGDSYIKAAYDMTDELDPQLIQKDLDEIISVYNQINFNATSMANKQENNENFNYKSFHQKTEEAGLKFSEIIVSRFVASLCTKPFVICSGLSGSGKTKLAQSFVQWICKSEEQYKIVPV
ncbi:MAG: hypothetical protein M3Q56_10640 [Bacteroidota bacterium]|nr:hypothetical protein [Bacteroidota bacterium]